MKTSFLLLFVFLSLSFTLFSQEISIPMDMSGKIDVIDEELNKKIDIFTTYSNFVEARLFRLNDSINILEVRYKIDGKIATDKKNLSISQTDDLRKRISQALKAKSPSLAINQEGRTSFLIGTTTLSLAYYGWSVPVVLNVNDGKLAVALYLVTSAAGFFVPAALTSNHTVTYGMAGLSLYGGTIGIVDGLFLSRIILHNGDFQGIMGLTMATSLAGLISGYYIADKYNVSGGSAEVISTVGTYGILQGLAAAKLISNFDGNSWAWYGLAGNAVGIFGGNLIANSQNFTRGDASVFLTASALSTYLVPSTAYLMKLENVNTFLSITMVANLAGMYLGDELVKDRDFTDEQGTLISLGSTAGGLFGAGLGYLFSSDNSDNISRNVLFFSALAAAGTFTGLYLGSEKEARIKKSGYLNFQFHPENIIFASKNTNPNLYLPIFSINGRF